MSSIVKNITGRLLVTVFGALLLLSVYFIVSSYFSFLRNSEADLLARLHSISSTLSMQIDGDQLMGLLTRYPEKDAIKKNSDDPDYQAIHDILLEAYTLNGLKSPIYTLTWQADRQNYCFGVTSAENPYYRHEYSTFPKELPGIYQSGGVLPAFEDEHGSWLSAVAPVKDRHGNVTAVIEVDEPFDEFIQRARQELWRNIGITLAIFLVVGFFLFRLIKSLLAQEEASKLALEESNRIIEAKNKHITDSINYASRIQQALVPEHDEIYQFLPDAFILYKPKDVVSGDFYWFNSLTYSSLDKNKHQLLLATVDCTGHGVPGAMMSVIGNSLLNEIVKEKKITQPAEILNQLNASVIKTLKQDEKSAQSKDGMDVALCHINLDNLEIQVAAAYRPIYYVKDGELLEIKGNKFPIGGSQFDFNRKFTNHTLQLSNGDAVYLFTDGYVDQFGGPNNKKFMSKRLKQLIAENKDRSMEEQCRIINRSFEEWKGEYNQIDDVAFIGIKF